MLLLVELEELYMRIEELLEGASPRKMIEPSPVELFASLALHYSVSSQLNEVVDPEMTCVPATAPTASTVASTIFTSSLVIIKDFCITKLYAESNSTSYSLLPITAHRTFRHSCRDMTHRFEYSLHEALHDHQTEGLSEQTRALNSLK